MLKSIFGETLFEMCKERNIVCNESNKFLICVTKGWLFKNIYLTTKQHGNHLIKSLTHFSPMFRFYTHWKWNIGLKWVYRKAGGSCQWVGNICNFTILVTWLVGVATFELIQIDTISFTILLYCADPIAYFIQKCKIFVVSCMNILELNNNRNFNGCDFNCKVS